jgi:hypothetical protein
MKGLVAVLLALVLAGLAAWYFYAASDSAPPAEMTEVEIAQIEAEVTEWADAWMAVWEQNDCNAAVPFFHPTKTAFLWQGKALSRAAWLEECNPVVANRVAFAGHWTSVEVEVLTPNVVHFLGTYTDTIRYESGRARTWAENSQLGLVERTPDGWVFTSIAATSGPAEEIEEG